MSWGDLLLTYYLFGAVATFATCSDPRFRPSHRDGEPLRGGPGRWLAAAVLAVLLGWLVWPAVVLHAQRLRRG